jgi:hypothetical protein
MFYLSELGQADEIRAALQGPHGRNRTRDAAHERGVARKAAAISRSNQIQNPEAIMKTIQKCSLCDIVKLSENQVSIGDHKRPYQAGHQFEFVAVLEGGVTVLVKNITNDRARLMFPAYAVEFHCSNPNGPATKKVKPLKEGVA